MMTDVTQWRLIQVEFTAQEGQVAVLEKKNGGGSDAFILKITESIDSEGNQTPAISKITQIGAISESSRQASSANDYCQSIAIDDEGIYCGGFTSGSLGESTAGGYDMFIWGLIK